KNIDMSFNKVRVDNIRGNDPSLRLLVRNLLSNAISYTPADGNITVSLSGTEQGVALVVEDNGPGISESDRERVMERFYRAENHQAMGCGIGLSIVDRIVQMHRGTLQLSPADNSQGLKVTVLLPKFSM
ncbi:MAG: sensor histidine kinase, partial [Gammaproteobacteria bacterium]|nr:sensor histidine kinase [Gammaproteobacteria bacterium]